MPVSAVRCWGCAVVLLVSSLPRHSCPCAKKFARRLCVIAKVRKSSPSALKMAQIRRFCACWASIFAEMPVEGRRWASFFAPTGAVARSCRRCGALQAAAMGVLRHAKPSCGVSEPCMASFPPRLVAAEPRVEGCGRQTADPLGEKSPKTTVSAEWVCDLAESIAVVVHCSHVNPLLRVLTRYLECGWGCPGAY